MLDSPAEPSLGQDVASARRSGPSSARGEGASSQGATLQGEGKPKSTRAPKAKKARRGKSSLAKLSLPSTEKLMAAGRLLMGAGLFFGLMAASTFGLYRYVSSTPRFAIKKLSIEGASHLSELEVSRLAGVEQGKNIFAVDLETARRGLMSSPWVERATVDRKLPGSMKVTIVEREPVALVSLGGALYLSARGGDVFKRFANGDPTDLVVITGVGGEGEMLRDRDGVVALVRRAQELITEYERTGPAKSYPLQEVHMTEEGGANLVVGRDAVTLSLGRGPYRIKIERAARVLSEIDRRKGNASIVFLDNDAHPERVVARMR